MTTVHFNEFVTAHFVHAGLNAITQHLSGHFIPLPVQPISVVLCFMYDPQANDSVQQCQLCCCTAAGWRMIRDTGTPWSSAFCS